MLKHPLPQVTQGLAPRDFCLLRVCPFISFAKTLSSSLISDYVYFPNPPVSLDEAP